MTELSVVRFAAGWRIWAGRRWRGCYDFRVDAIEAVVRLAAELRRRDEAVTVLVQEPFGEMRPFDPDDAKVVRLEVGATAARAFAADKGGRALSA